MALATRALGIGQWAVDAAQRMTHPGVARTLQARCANAGTVPNASVTLTWEDRDNNGLVSPGDSILVAMNACGSTTMAGSATGGLRIDVQAGTSAALDTLVLLRVTPQSDLVLGAITDTRETRLSGAFNVRWEQDQTSQSLRVTTQGDEELRYLSFFAPADGRPDRVWHLEAWRRTDFAATETQGGMSFDCDLSDGGGSLTVRTLQPLKLTFNGEYSSGLVRIQGLEGYIDVGPNGRASFTAKVINPSINEVVRQASLSAYQTNGVMMWYDYAELAQRAFENHVAAWMSFDPALFGLPSSEYDRLLVHPVLPQPSLTSPQAVIRIQFSQPLADVQPALNVRFSDCGSSDGVGGWSVAATVERHGSLFFVRPVERLRQGRSYAVRVTDPSGDLSVTAQVRLADGTLRPISGFPGQCIRMPSDLLVELTGDGTSVIGPDGSTTLRAEVNAVRGQRITGYRWEQISGAPVRLGTPDAPSTTVRYADAGARLLDTVILQLVVTDALGNEQRARISVQVGDHMQTPGTGYTLVQTGDGRRIQSMTLVVAPDIGQWPNGAAAAWMHVVYTPVRLISGDGSALTVGRYDHAVPEDAAAPGPRLNVGISASSCLGTAAGWFDILELERNSFGAVERLAMDYEMTCTAPQVLAGPMRSAGSFRFNTTLPVNIMRPD